MVQTVKTTFAIKSIFMYSKGGYIMYVGGGPEGFTNFSKNIS